MPTSLTTLIANPRTGRARPVLIDSDDYALRVVRQGAPVPWLDKAALTGHVGQVAALLKSDAVWVDVADVYAAHLAANPALAEAMGAKSRTGYALRTLLGDEAATTAVGDMLRTVAQSARRPLVLDLPSPARWVGIAHAAAGTPVESVSADNADSGAMYVAEWLGRLGGVDVALLHLDATSSDGEPGTEPEALSDYSSITNVARHLGWSTALRRGDDLVLDGDDASRAVAVLPEAYWTGGAPAPEGDALVGRIPADATPETVLARVEELG